MRSKPEDSDRDERQSVDGDAASETAATAFGVYVHWPFCASKCPYCDFNSHVRSGGIDEARFLAAYLREIDATASRIGARTTQSVFFGGGTPSLMAPQTVYQILQRIDHHWPLKSNAELTLEANPGSVEAGRFAGYRAAGINRVSLGVQSLDDAVLRRLGRVHTADEAKAALAIARTTFERFSFDLIYARPGQTTWAWDTELTAALELAGDHLSLYQLTIETGTPFAKLHDTGKLVLPHDDLAAELYDLTQRRTSAAGLPAYEISNHASPGGESTHNLIYWRYGEYAGIGAGAHGRLRQYRQLFATSTERLPEAWLEKVEEHGTGLVENETLQLAEQADEALLMGLRLDEGVDLTELARRTGLKPSKACIAELIGMDLLDAPAPGRLKATGAGRFLLNQLVVQLSRSFEPAVANYVQQGVSG